MVRVDPGGRWLALVFAVVLLLAHALTEASSTRPVEVSPGAGGSGLSGLVLRTRGPEDDGNFRRLVRQLSEKTGLALGRDHAGRLRAENVLRGPAGHLLGSEYARRELLSYLAVEEPVFVFDDSGSGRVAIAKRQGNTIRLDFEDIDAIDYGEVDPATFDSAAILLHELAHVLAGKRDPTPTELARISPRMTGPAVDHVNLMREELELPVREHYRALRDGMGRWYLTFDGRPVFLSVGRDSEV